MTEDQLRKGQEILDSIRDLKYALGELEKSRMFNVSDTCTRVGNPFLSTLHQHIKSIGVTKINQEIKALELKLKNI